MFACFFCTAVTHLTLLLCALHAALRGGDVGDRAREGVGDHDVGDGPCADIRHGERIGDRCAGHEGPIGGKDKKITLPDA